MAVRSRTRNQKPATSIPVARPFQRGEVIPVAQLLGNQPSVDQNAHKSSFSALPPKHQSPPGEVEPAILLRRNWKVVAGGGVLVLAVLLVAGFSLSHQESRPPSKHEDRRKAELQDEVDHLKRTNQHLEEEVSSQAKKKGKGTDESGSGVTQQALDELEKKKAKEDQEAEAQRRERERTFLRVRISSVEIDLENCLEELRECERDYQSGKEQWEKLEQKRLSSEEFTLLDAFALRELSNRGTALGNTRQNLRNARDNIQRQLRQLKEELAQLSK